MLFFTIYVKSWAQFCCKMWGGPLDVKPIWSSGRCESEVL